MEIDQESRKNEVQFKWKLRETIFNYIYRELNSNPKIYLSAFQLNIQLRGFISHRPDPKCVTDNAFLLN